MCVLHVPLCLRLTGCTLEPAFIFRFNHNIVFFFLSRRSTYFCCKHSDWENTYQVSNAVGHFPGSDVAAVLGACQDAAKHLHHHSQTVTFVPSWGQTENTFRTMSCIMTLERRRPDSDLWPRCLRWAPVLPRWEHAWGPWSACPERRSPSPQGWNLHVCREAPPVETNKGVKHLSPFNPETNALWALTAVNSKLFV